MRPASLTLLAWGLLPPAAVADPRPAAVVHYDLRLELDIPAGRVSGALTVTARGQDGGADALVLDVGELKIDSVRLGRARLPFVVEEHRLTARLPDGLPSGRSLELEVAYHGRPKRGLRFFPERQQAYTVFSTSQWMPAVDAPDQKATLRLRLVAPAGLEATGSGRSVARRTLSASRVEHEWTEQAPLPTYVFGFAVGPFRRATASHRGVRLEYLGASFSDAELRRIFAETDSMLDFFEERAGVRIPGASYSQVLLGDFFQKWVYSTEGGSSVAP